MTRDDKDVVSAVARALAERVGKDRYETWFGGDTRLAYDGAALRVMGTSRAFMDWLRAKLRREVEAAVRQAIPGPCPVVFEVIEETAPKTTEIDAAPMTLEAPPVTRNHDHRLLAFPAPPTAAAPASRRRWATLGQFVVGASNRLAHATALSVTERPGETSPALFYGPTGVGKTHLLEGVWSAARQSRQALFLTAEQFTTQFLEALRGSGLPSFRRKCRSVDVLLVDDLQFFAGKRATLVELLHTIDHLVRDGKQVALTADRALEDLAGLGPELVSRLQGGMLCRLDPADEAVRQGIVRQLAANMNLKAPADVLDYVASQFTSHARELQGALNLLQAESRARGASLTLAFAEEALRDLVRQSGRSVRLGDIEKAVCEVFALAPDSLQSDSKAQLVSQPRMLAMFLARKLTSSAYSEIGHHFGRRKHTTVISAQKKVGALLEQNATIRLHNREYRIDEAVRKVEAALKIG